MIESIKKKKIHSIKEAMPKIERYCVYQERCQKEVKFKLFDLGLNEVDSLTVMSDLIKRGFLNEERFAIAFAGGKFRQKNWGKTKITKELKARNISDFCIKKAISQIEDDDYLKKGKFLVEKYLRTHRDNNPMILKNKTLKHLISKGFEYDQSHEIINTFNWK